MMSGLLLPQVAASIEGQVTTVVPDGAGNFVHRRDATGADSEIPSEHGSKPLQTTCRPCQPSQDPSLLPSLASSTVQHNGSGMQLMSQPANPRAQPITELPFGILTRHRSLWKNVFDICWHGVLRHYLWMVSCCMCRRLVLANPPSTGSMCLSAAAHGQ